MDSWRGSSSIPSQRTITTDAQGAFSITSLPQGQRYMLSATASGYGPNTRLVAADEAETNSFQLQPSITLKVANFKLEGLVVDTDNKPIAGAHVNINGASQPAATATTDSKGHFTFQQVCEGPVRVTAMRQPGFNGQPGLLARGNVQAQGGETNVVVKVGINAPGIQVLRQAPPAIDLR